ncbi:MAG TPA: PilZ domain-containing protein [Sphingomicrobium sp.]|nr:PilZ domain-containing protein [Sphingomicrobium sp.]
MAYSNRQADRIALDADVSLRRSGQNLYRVRVYDASTHGCKLEFVERPRIDEHVWVKFDGLDAIESAVCWVDGFVVGVEFVRPMYPPVFDALVARLR